jgi:NitT/TauT family transport system permease protein
VISDANAESRGTTSAPKDEGPERFRSLRRHRRPHETLLGTIVLGALPFIGVIAIWQLVSSTGGHSLALAVPSPHSTWRALVSDVSHQPIWSALSVTLQEVGLGLLIAGVAGVIVGVFTGLSPVAHAVLWPLVVFFQAIPKVALAPLMIVALGFGMSSKVAVAASVAFFPVMVGVAQGARNIRTDELELMKSLCASRTQTLLKVRLQRALPAAFAGFQLAVTLGLLGAVVTEFVGASKGIGYLIAQRGATLNVPGMYSAIIVLSVVAVILSLLLSFVDRRLSNWSEA